MLNDATFYTTDLGTLTNDGIVDLIGGTTSLTVTNNWMIRWDGASTINSYLTTSVGSTLRSAFGSQAADLVIANGFTNNGGILFTSANDHSLTVLSGALTNSVDGVILASVGVKGGEPESRAGEATACSARTRC